MCLKVEWVEIIPSKSGKLMYANLKTGECSWDQPKTSPNINIRRINDQTQQWWELSDVKSARFYCNVNTSETKWQKPKEEGVIIIPLAKLQLSKQNTLPPSDDINSERVDNSTQTNSSFIYCSNASTQTSPPTGTTTTSHHHIPHHHSHHSRHCSSSHAHNHSAISERSLRHYLLNEARFAGLCYNIDDNYYEGSDEEEYDGEAYEGSSDESYTDNWDADDEDNNEGEEDEYEEETDEESEDVIDGRSSYHRRDETDTSDYYETSSFVYYKKSASFTSGLGSLDASEKPIKSAEDNNTGILDIVRAEKRKTKDKSSETEHSETSEKILRTKDRDEEGKVRKKDKLKEIKKEDKENDDTETKPVPPRRGISLDSSIIQAQTNEQLEKYARENIKRHLKKGGLNQMLKRRHSLKGMLIWTKFSIKQPMIATLMNDNDLKQEAINCFKLIQQYCGDRGKGNTKNVGTKTNTLVRREEVAKELITKGVVRGLLLRDEIFVQLCRQTTENPLDESLQLGLELIALCLYYFGPSQKFAPYLSSFLSSHKSEFARKICLKKLDNKMESLGGSNSSVGAHCRKPASVQEISMVIQSIKRGYLGMFGESLNNLMTLQGNYLPKRKLPWIQVTLSETILRLGGAEQEGIFRIAGDVEETTMLKLYIDCLQPDKELETDFIVLCNKWKGILCHEGDVNLDVNVFACLLKQWFRELREPVIPYSFYQEALHTCESPSNAIYMVEKKLPAINKLVIGYLIRFLQVFSAKQNVDFTKMDENNLSMVWAPNILRAPPNSNTMPTSNSPNATLIFENTRKEMTFIRTLIQYLDTSYIQGVI
ncbi:rho GTPase-activating protein 39-like isoform X2 [Panonychus citri]|uniref:rho GTPase-activating protein 39-like isoform X2 n=1 Tax=Panonychus citri TaxID=50023 RepID=UPI00230780F3|nr:rho GTPase-activating protein 39-like isoform X2 [Panonychus citri]